MSVRLQLLAVKALTAPAGRAPVGAAPVVVNPFPNPFALNSALALAEARAAAAVRGTDEKSPLPPFASTLAGAGVGKEVAVGIGGGFFGPYFFSTNAGAGIGATIAVGVGK